MALRDPVAVYEATSNLAARAIKLFLEQADVEAFFPGDHGDVGLWDSGVEPQLQKPQIWVGSEDVARAKELLEEYEQQIAARNERERQQKSLGGPAIDVLCEECEERSSFPSTLRGTIQDCPRCGAFVDVEEYWICDKEIEDEPKGAAEDE